MEYEVHPSGYLCGCGATCTTVCGASCQSTATTSGVSIGDNAGKKYSETRVKYDDTVIETFGGMNMKDSNTK